MKIIFTEWKLGHHGHHPDPVDANDVDHAFRIFSAVACALTTGEKIRAKVENAQGDVLARFMADDDESPSTDYPKVGDSACTECFAFWSLCDCEEGGFVPMEPEGLEHRTPEMLEAMNAYLASGDAKIEDALPPDMGARLEAAAFSSLQDHARRQYEMYNAKGEPLANGPRCATCGDLIAWGSHPMCERDDAGEIFRAGERHNQ